MRTAPAPSTEKNIAPAITCTAPWRLIKINPIKDYRLKVEQQYHLPQSYENFCNDFKE